MYHNCNVVLRCGIKRDFLMLISWLNNNFTFPKKNMLRVVKKSIHNKTEYFLYTLIKNKNIVI